MRENIRQEPFVIIFSNALFHPISPLATENTSRMHTKCNDDQTSKHIHHKSCNASTLLAFSMRLVKNSRFFRVLDSFASGTDVIGNEQMAIVFGFLNKLVYIGLRDDTRVDCADFVINVETHKTIASSGVDVNVADVLTWIQNKESGLEIEE